MYKTAEKVCKYLPFVFQMKYITILAKDMLDLSKDKLVVHKTKFKV